MSLPDYPAFFYPLAAIAILLAGISKGGFGAIAGGLAVPIMSIVIPPQEAAGIMLPILCAMDLFTAQAYWGRWASEHLRILLPSGILGIALGALAFGVLSTDAIRLIVGLIAVLFACNKWFDLSNKLTHRFSIHSRPPGKIAGIICGMAAAFTSTLAHAGGPPFAIYIYSQKLDKTLIVATSAGFFLICNYVKLIPYYFLGQLSLDKLGVSLLFSPLVPLGVWLGIWLHKRVREQIFFHISYILLFSSGMKLIYDALI